MQGASPVDPPSVKSATYPEAMQEQRMDGLSRWEGCFAVRTWGTQAKMPQETPGISLGAAEQ